MFRILHTDRCIEGIPDTAFYGFILPFGMSSAAGAAISLILIEALKKAGIMRKLVQGENL
ncbi:MAG TPA: hypothetical protein VN131_03750 [Mobilitalea sp.]|nr:hypothetical protein [Mobilitalea sp.]